MIYHSITTADWTLALKNGVYSPASIEKQGFIHCSMLDQLVSITNLVFSARPDLIILEIDEKKVTAKVVHEDLKGHGRFPHIYGALNLDAVVKTYPMLTDSNPESKVAFTLPPELRQQKVELN